MSKLAWSYLHGRMPAGIANSLEEMRDQRQLRQNRLLNVPRTNNRLGQNQIDVTLPIFVNNNHDSLLASTSKNVLVRKIKKHLGSRYRQVVTCNNEGCNECRVV